jgi:hypothetical protein
MRRITFAVAMLAGLAGSARADGIPQIDGLPPNPTYTPGIPFSFEVRAPGLPDFSGFNVQLLFEASVPDPDLSAVAVEPSSQYPFPSGAFSSGGLPPDPGGDTYTLMFSGGGPSVFTTAGVNDLLAIVTVTPGADLTGEIDISFGNQTVLSYNQEGGTFPLPGTLTVEQAEPVPAPAGIILAGIGGVLLSCKRWLSRSGTTTA